MNAFIPGQLIYPTGQRDRIYPVLVLEATPNPNCRNGSWIVTIVPMERPTPIYNVRMFPRFWTSMSQ